MATMRPFMAQSLRQAPCHSHHVLLASHPQGQLQFVWWKVALSYSMRHWGPILELHTRLPKLPQVKPRTWLRTNTPTVVFGETTQEGLLRGFSSSCPLQEKWNLPIRMA